MYLVSSMNRVYRIEDFDYDLPESLIAQKPAKSREGSRLLICNRANGTLTDDYFYNLAQYLEPQTCLVVNNSKVEECRLIFGALEIFVLKNVDRYRAVAMVRPGKKFKRGAQVALMEDLFVYVDEVTDEGHRILRFSEPLDSKKIATHRHIPLPPYIRQDDSLKKRYQTRYAKPLGSKAAPTAGLHFSDSLLRNLKKDFGFAEVTLHVGLGTFAPISNNDIAKQKLHSEYYEISQDATIMLEKAHHVTAVGTTTLRTLESASSRGRKIIKPSSETSIFIQPGYNFNMVDSLITNFHLPKSSLLMLVAAFMGYDETMHAYHHAIAKKYRFFSFGDAMLIV